MGVRCPRGTGAALLSELAARETDECVEWPYATSPHGYGCVWIDGRQHLAHRVALAHRQRPPSDKALALHGPCHNPRCVNYRHLRWGSPRENQLDRRRDGTSNGGERNSRAKLTPADVEAIRSRYEAGGVRQSDLASLFGVVQQTVSSIVRGEAWES